MIYHQFQDIKLSALGMGTMRLPVIDGKDGNVDVEKAEEMLDIAYKSGINYFDTAFGYHDGTSEVHVGNFLKKYPRDSFYLATKFPGYDVSNMDKVEEIFETQLKKLQVEYFDFYLIHNVSEHNVDPYIDPKYGIYEYLLKQKANGRIKHLGFSTHGTIDTMKKFLAVYGKDMEFCMIELNYFDWIFQNAKGKVELLNSLNIPIWNMEPVRGGQLANVKEKYIDRLKAIRPNDTPAELAMRFVKSVKGDTVVLTGSSSKEQMEANIKVFSDDDYLSEADFAALEEIAKDMIAETAVPCTACSYCTSHCPMGLNIPEFMRIYNELNTSGSGDFIGLFSTFALPEGKKPTNCIGCGSCAKVCPQQIAIPGVIRKINEKLSANPYA